MTPLQAEQLLRQEVASGSAVGKALLVFLEGLELEAYRQSSRTADPVSLGIICGRGQGLHSALNRIAPTAAAAPTDRPAAPM